MAREIYAESPLFLKVFGTGLYCVFLFMMFSQYINAINHCSKNKNISGKLMCIAAMIGFALINIVALYELIN